MYDVGSIQQGWSGVGSLGQCSYIFHNLLLQVTSILLSADLFHIPPFLVQRIHSCFTYVPVVMESQLQNHSHTIHCCFGNGRPTSSDNYQCLLKRSLRISRFGYLLCYTLIEKVKVILSYGLRRMMKHEIFMKDR